MGAWGTGVFENDTAMDWCDEFIEAPEGEGDEENEGKHVLLLGPIQMVANPDEEDEESIDADDASVALAAAEVIAAINNKPSEELAKADEDPLSSLSAWIGSNSEDLLRKREVRDLAAKAVQQVLEDSELADLWEESEHAEEWQGVVKGLQKRLEAN